MAGGNANPGKDQRRAAQSQGNRVAEHQQDTYHRKQYQGHKFHFAMFQTGQLFCVARLCSAQTAACR